MEKNITAKHSPQGAAFTRLILETFRFNGQLLAAGNRLAEEYGITSALWQVLGSIDGESMTVAQIARNMGLTRQSVQRSANVLEKKGIVAFEDNKHHKRARLVTFTEKGREIMDQVNEMQANWANGIAKDFSESELNAATALMTKLAKRL